jgi:hypothetical protein
LGGEQLKEPQMHELTYLPSPGFPNGVRLFMSGARKPVWVTFRALEELELIEAASLFARRKANRDDTI